MDEVQEQLEDLQIRLEVFANKLSRAYEEESQYIKQALRKDREIAKLKEELNVLKNEKG